MIEYVCRSSSVVSPIAMGRPPVQEFVCNIQINHNSIFSEFIVTQDGAMCKSSGGYKEKILKHIRFLIAPIFPQEVFLMRSQLFMVRFCHRYEQV
jgi:hypothetical protein